MASSPRVLRSGQGELSTEPPVLLFTNWYCFIFFALFVLKARTRIDSFVLIILSEPHVLAPRGYRLFFCTQHVSVFAA